MSDIVERLRTLASGLTYPDDEATCLEAADEIERLNRRLDEASAIIDEMENYTKHLQALVAWGALEPF